MYRRERLAHTERERERDTHTHTHIFIYIERVRLTLTLSHIHTHAVFFSNISLLYCIDTHEAKILPFLSHPVTFCDENREGQHNTKVCSNQSILFKYPFSLFEADQIKVRFQSILCIYVVYDIFLSVLNLLKKTYTTQYRIF